MSISPSYRYLYKIGHRRCLGINVVMIKRQYVLIVVVVVVILVVTKIDGSNGSGSTVEIAQSGKEV